MQRPSFLDHDPVAIGFGTSGMRGLVRDLTDLQTYINVSGALRYLMAVGDVAPASTVLIGGDLRPSTDRIARASIQAILDCGLSVENCGKLPTPALVLHGIETKRAAVMVTGSHIPFDRNGIKVSRTAGEVLKSDEPGILRAIEEVRAQEYAHDAASSAFDPSGMLKRPPTLPPVDDAAQARYVARYVGAFAHALRGVRMAFYQHSAVGRELVPRILRELGATVVTVGLSETFVPIDTENLTDDGLRELERLVDEAERSAGHAIDAIVSTDGDSDRPLVAAVLQQTGQRVRFLPGDLLGLVVADYLGAEVAAVPVSANDAVDLHLGKLGVQLHKTKIGSPYVIEALDDPRDRRRVGWEANGGFLVGSAIAGLAPLPTRDAVLPIIVNLVAASAKRLRLEELWAQLPPRFGRSGLLDDVANDRSRALLAKLDRALVGQLFTTAHGFGSVAAIDTLDGVRISFDNGDVAHLRASGNAPQLRVYATADTQSRADDIVTRALAPDGIIARLLMTGVGAR